MQMKDSVYGNREPAIDSLRAFAALSVLFCHTALAVSTGVPWFDGFMAFFASHGGHGLDLFFVLSGYCIHRGYAFSSRPFSVKDYLVRRWWRIYPPYFFALGFAVWIHVGSALLKYYNDLPVPIEDLGVFQILTHVVLVHNLFDSANARINGPFWTIAVEVQFYLLYLLIRPHLSGKGWLRMAGAALVLGLAGWWWHYGDFQPLQPFRHWFQWIVGAYAAYAYKKYHFSIGQGLLFLGCSATALTAGALVVPAGSFWEMILLGVGFAFLTLAFLTLPKGLWSFPPLTVFPAIGFFSYSLYLVHHPIVGRLRAAWIPGLPEGLPQVAASVGGIVLAIGFAYLFFLLFEKDYIQTAKRSGAGKT